MSSIMDVAFDTCNEFKIWLQIDVGSIKFGFGIYNFVFV